MPSLREQAERTAQLIVEQYQRGGSLPSPLVKAIKAECWKRGHPFDDAQIERALVDMARPFAERMLTVADAGGDVETDVGEVTSNA
jgi:hypothetical protein